MKKQETNNSLLYSIHFQGKDATRWFTLVELIVVITILTILWTIAFISLQWYSKNARDSVRISDMSKIKTTLELFQLNAWKYPETTDVTNITYSWAIAWTQWTFWETTFSNVSKLDKIPTDPVTDRKYVYSVTNTKQEYQLAWVMEWDEVTWLLNQTNAAQKTAMVKISWNYNWKLLKVTTWSIDYVLAVPSIITSSWFTLEQIIANKLLAYNWYKNLPAQYAGLSYEILWDEDIKLVNTGALVIYSWDIKILSDTTSIWTIARKNLIENLQNAYTWTTITNVWEIAQILNTDIIDSTATEFLSTTIVNNNLWWSITVTPTYSNCDLAWEIVTHNTSITAYETNSVTYWNTCNSEQRLCNNWILDWTFTFTWCTVQWATWTFNLSQTTVTQWTNVTITNNCSTPPTSYTSSNTAVATVAWTTITTLSAWTTDITPVWWACGDNASKTLTVTTPPITDWRSKDPNCDIPDITIWTQTWAWCNSTLWTWIEYSVDQNCYNYVWWTTTWCNKPSNTKENVYDAIYWVNNIWWKLYIRSEASKTDWTWPCRSGYHLPSNANWETLETTLNWWTNCRNATDWRLCDWLWWAWHTSKTDTNNIVNALKLPLAGYRNTGGVTFYSRGNTTDLWSSTLSSSNAYSMNLYRNYSTVNRSINSPAYGFSVRCLKD
jgi:uncharacterized protein (TIGR02145 family)